MALDPAAADDLHHQVHGQLAVEAREERVPGEVDLVLVERGVRGVPLLVRDRGVGRLERAGEPRERLVLDAPDARSAASSSSASRTS